jgi:hypothetical protein
MTSVHGRDIDGRGQYFGWPSLVLKIRVRKTDGQPHDTRPGIYAATMQSVKTNPAVRLLACGRLNCRFGRVRFPPHRPSAILLPLANCHCLRRCSSPQWWRATPVCWRASMSLHHDSSNRP